MLAILIAGGIALLGTLAAGCGMVGNDAEQSRATVEKACLDCHNSAERTAGLNLETRDFHAVNIGDESVISSDDQL